MYYLKLSLPFALSLRFEYQHGVDDMSYNNVLSTQLASMMFQIIVVCHSLLDNGSNFVILFKVASLPAVGNTQGEGSEEILTTGPADSAQHV